MTQSISDPPEDNKKEAASFFSKWMNRVDKNDTGDNWDEVCMQWCKQKNTARQQESDPDCRMLCLRHPLLKEQVKSTSWNPLKGYSVIVINGKEECITHINDMKSETAQEELNLPEDTEVSMKSKRYELDLGNVWAEADTKARHLVNENVVPLYNSTVEQAIAWKNSPEAAQWQDYVKSKASALFSQIYPMQPLNMKEKKPETTPPSSSDEK